MKRPFEPKLITVLREGYSLSLLRKDLLAGIIVGIVAVPLSIAFAIASGVKPEQGLITAVFAGFLISACSGSRVQIGGPTGAFIVIIYGIVEQYGYEGLALATLMAGVMLVLLGIARFGDVIKYIPYPVTVGFTSGIALIIFSSQMYDLFGLNIPHLPAHFLSKWIAYGEYISSVNACAVGLGIITIIISVYWHKITDRIPGSLIAIILTTALVHILNLPVDTIGSRFGTVSAKFSLPHIPHFNWDLIVKMSSPAMTIALLAGIESLLSAVVADGMTGKRHRSNMELIAQGIANIVSPLFNGIPATGAIARTATNIKNGGQTPFAGIIHTIVVLLIFLFFGKWAALIPMATLAGILIIVAYNMSEWHMFVKLFSGPKSDVLVLLTTFFLTVFVDLTVAIEVGMVLASFLFMKRMVQVTEVKYLKEDSEELEEQFEDLKIPKGVDIFEINGPFFFGAADKFKDTLNQMKTPPKVLILRMRHVPVVDATGLRALEDLLHKARRSKMMILFCEVQAQPYQVFESGQILERLGKEYFHDDLESCLQHAQELLK